MQLRIKYPFLLAAVAIILFASCSKTNKEGRYIPEQAIFALHLNGESLSSKLPWDEIKKNQLFKEAYEDSSTTALMKSVMDDPENTGIDVKTDIILFVARDSSVNYMAIEGTIKDEAKFKKFTTEAGKDKAVISEKNGLNFSDSKDMTAAWNKEKFVLVGDIKSNDSDRYRGLYDSAYTPAPEVKVDRITLAEKIFNLKEDKSLGKDEKFSELMSEKGDVHFWMNMEELSKVDGLSTAAMGPLSMLNTKKIYEGSRVTGTLTFENGKLNMDFRSYMGKEMSDLVKKYSGDKIDADMVKRIPSKNIAGLFVFNFKPEGLREYIKLLGVEGFANMGTGMLGFTLDDFIKANKGDIMLAVSDIAQDSSGRPNASFLFSASIGDKPSFNKLIEAANKFGKDKFNGSEGPAVFYNLNDNLFALGNKKQDVDAYIGKAGANSFDFMDKIAGTSGGAYINFQYIMKTFAKEASRDSLDQAMFDASLKMWDNMVAYSGGNESGASVQHLEINLVDKSTNSLKQLNNYFSELGAIKKKKDDRWKTDYSEEPALVDTTTVVPAK